MRKGGEREVGVMECEKEKERTKGEWERRKVSKRGREK